MTANATEKLADAALWHSFKSGDYDAFVAIYRRYFKILVTYGSRFTTDKTVLEDAVQDLFVSLWRRRDRLGNLDDVENLKFYLLRAMRNQMIRNCSQNLFDQAEEIDSFLDYLIELSAEQLAIDAEAQRGLQEKVRLSIAGLSPRQREAVNLRFYQGMNLDQTASIMGISKQVVSNMLSKAYSVLRLALGALPAWVGSLLHFQL